MRYKKVSVGFGKKHFYLAWIIGLILLLVGCSAHKNPVAVRQNFMINDTLYVTPYFQYIHARPDTTVEIGQIQSQTEGVATENLQANGLAIGTTVYQDPDKPWQAYCGNDLYLTEEVSRGYLRYDGELYVHLGNVDFSNEYYEGYVDQYGLLSAVPPDAKLIGVSHFEEYGAYPEDNMGTNFIQDECEVYQCKEDTAVLFMKTSDQEVFSYVRYAEEKREAK